MSIKSFGLEIILKFFFCIIKSSLINLSKVLQQSILAHIDLEGFGMDCHG